MKWANFLHFYQPADQQPDILESIVAQSYRPIIDGIKKHKNVRLTININGALFELLHKYGYKDLIEDIKKLVKEERIEITGSAKYHALLPLLSPEEIKRQIELNTETLRHFLGDYTPNGFFPPEMAYDEKIIAVVEELGFKWMILDEISCGGEVGKVDYSQIYKLKDTKMNVFFRDRRLSNLIMSAVVRSHDTLTQAMQKELGGGNFIVTAMDAETFGHHRPGLEKMLFEVFDAPEFELVKISDIEKHYKEKEKISPAKATWASSKEDIEKGIQFLSWNDPENMIHKWQWELTKLVLHEVYNMDKAHSRYALVREKMDKGLASDHFWWASAKPWWSLEMIESGVFNLLDTLRHIPDVKKETLDEGRDFYEKIVSTAFNWQRTGKIRSMMQSQNNILRIPFKDRTLGRPGAENVYYAFLSMMEKLKKESAKRGEYEQAILWRDAIYKLKHKLDIYDTMNAIDLVRVKIPHDEVEKVIVEYEEKYKRLRGGQPEQRGS
jgi:alpha-amylase/alpha-mannosidase (GH57 family)